MRLLHSSGGWGPLPLEDDYDFVEQAQRQWSKTKKRSVHFVAALGKVDGTRHDYVHTIRHLLLGFH